MTGLARAVRRGVYQSDIPCATCGAMPDPLYSKRHIATQIEVDWARTYSCGPHEPIYPPEVVKLRAVLKDRGRA